MPGERTGGNRRCGRADVRTEREQVVEAFKESDVPGFRFRNRQLGECRIKLVSFDASSPQHNRAQEYLRQREGSTGLFVFPEFTLAMEEELKFAQWGSYPLTLAHYEIRGAHRLADARPTIVEMLALRRAAQRVVEITETLLVSIVPITAGRTGPLKFCVSMTGPNVDEARHVVEQVVSQVQSSMPESLELVVNVVAAEPGTTAQQLLA